MATGNKVTLAVMKDDPQNHEDVHVHAIYDEIASHFSSTRYKPWPIIAQFMSDIPTGWVGLDSGTGNGKYLPLPHDRPGALWTIGLDRSRNLLQIARNVGGPGTIREVVRGDVLGDGWRHGAFDYAISIATIHHLASSERRKLAIQRLLRCVSATHGRILVYVWAIEQDELSTRKIPSQDEEYSPRDGVEDMGKDVFVPWVLSQQSTSKIKIKAKGEESSFASPSTDIDIADSSAEASAEKSTPQVFHRYYHMFAGGELIELASCAARDLGLYVGARSDLHEEKARGVELVRHGWERSNHYVELRCWEK